jgi:hypothetical protein
LRYSLESGDAVEQGDEADEAFGGMVARMDMPPHARAVTIGRGHRFAAYPRCSTDSGRIVRNVIAIGGAAAWLIGSALCVPSGLAQALAPAGQTGGSTMAGFRYPRFELQGKLSATLTVSVCEYISGMTCKVRYTGVHPLPSRVYFAEFDETGHQAGPEVRLLYPRLEPGETGSATFRLRLLSPARVRLRGEWKGQWQNPY